MRDILMNRWSEWARRLRRRHGHVETRRAAAVMVFRLPVWRPLTAAPPTSTRIHVRLHAPLGIVLRAFARGDARYGYGGGESREGPDGKCARLGRAIRDADDIGAKLTARARSGHQRGCAHEPGHPANRPTAGGLSRANGKGLIHAFS